MSRDAILDKLRPKFAEPINTEERVVYILAEIRKFLERSEQAKNYFALDFYCSFALHTVMDKNGAHRILKRFDEAYPYIVANKKPPDALESAIKATANLMKFRDELELLVTENGLPRRLFEDRKEWLRFMSCYCEVIDECELRLHPDFEGLNYINSIEIRREGVHFSQHGAPDRRIFSLIWLCKGKDGTMAHYTTQNEFDED